MANINPKFVGSGTAGAAAICEVARATWDVGVSGQELGRGQQISVEH